MSSKPLYIFDLDGTLALIEHRRHYVERPSLKCFDCGGANRKNCVQCSDLDAEWKPDWRRFFEACIDDEPNEPVIATFRTLQKAGAELWIWSGRSDEVRAETEAWLRRHKLLSRAPAVFYAPEAFRMRKASDHQDDVSLKSGWLAEIEPPEYKRLTAVFDDRARVVQMWRDAGVTCFQVATGEF